MGIRVFTDSTSYIDEETCRRLNIQVIQLSVHFPDESFKENEVEHSYFYSKIEKTGIIPTSSQPSQGSFLMPSGIAWLKATTFGDFISSAMSGTCANARSAREGCRSFPARIEIVDSYTNCMALGLQVIATEAAKAGGSMEVLSQPPIPAAESITILSPDLEYLKREAASGRLQPFGFHPSNSTHSHRGYGKRHDSSGGKDARQCGCHQAHAEMLEEDYRKKD